MLTVKNYNPTILCEFIGNTSLKIAGAQHVSPFLAHVLDFQYKKFSTTSDVVCCCMPYLVTSNHVEN